MTWAFLWFPPVAQAVHNWEYSDQWWRSRIHIWELKVKQPVYLWPYTPVITSGGSGASIFTPPLQTGRHRGVNIMPWVRNPWGLKKYRKTAEEVSSTYITNVVQRFEWSAPWAEKGAIGQLLLSPCLKVLTVENCSTFGTTLCSSMSLSHTSQSKSK